jgi:AraC family transcriptional regulator
VHPVHLAREFRRAFGCTPAEYVRHRRVELAALLARTTSRPLAEIAAACGFVDQSHLTRAFARRFATSPAAYRRVMFRAYKTAT